MSLATGRLEAGPVLPGPTHQSVTSMLVREMILNVGLLKPVSSALPVLAPVVTLWSISPDP